MISRGLIIFVSGIILLIGTIIWIYKDNKSKDKRQEELLEKINKNSLNIKTSSNLSEKDDKQITFDNTEILEDSTELLNDSTVLLDDTEVI